MKKIYLLTAAALISVLAAVKMTTSSEKQATAKAATSIITPVLEGGRPGLLPAPAAVIATPQLATTEKVASPPDLEAIADDLKLDLQEINDRQLVAIVNDPEGNAEVRKAAIEFLNNYLKKLSNYMNLKNKEIQRWAKQ